MCWPKAKAQRKVRKRSRAGDEYKVSVPVGLKEGGKYDTYLIKTYMVRGAHKREDPPPPPHQKTVIGFPNRVRSTFYAKGTTVSKARVSLLSISYGDDELLQLGITVEF